MFMNTSQQIEVVHSDTTITYNEREDKWQFTLRGRDRSADSLAKAKEYIDKPVAAEKAKPFEKIDAWFFEYTDDPKKVQVTGIAESRYSSSPEVWINSKEGRKRVQVRYKLFVANEQNDTTVGQMVARKNQIDLLRKEISNLKEKLIQLEIPKEE